MRTTYCLHTRATLQTRADALRLAPRLSLSRAWYTNGSLPSTRLDLPPRPNRLSSFGKAHALGHSLFTPPIAYCTPLYTPHTRQPAPSSTLTPSPRRPHATTMVVGQTRRRFLHHQLHITDASRSTCLRYVVNRAPFAAHTIAFTTALLPIATLANRLSLSNLIIVVGARGSNLSTTSLSDIGD